MWLNRIARSGNHNDVKVECRRNNLENYCIFELAYGFALLHECRVQMSGKCACSSALSTMLMWDRRIRSTRTPNKLVHPTHLLYQIIFAMGHLDIKPITFKLGGDEVTCTMRELCCKIFELQSKCGKWRNNYPFVL